jgi:hypothetical protein
METGGAVRASGRHVTRGANIPAINQPNAGQRYMRPLCQNGNDPLQEFIHMPDLGHLQ